MTLVTVQGTIRLEANAAASFARVDAKFGGGLTITAPYGGHRTEAQQAYLRQGYVRGLPGFNYAAPARKSNHEGRAPDWEGFAVDISNWRSYPKLHAAMVAEGWVRDPVELWHYNYTGKRTQLVGVAGNVIKITSTGGPELDATERADLQSAKDEARSANAHATDAHNGVIQLLDLAKKNATTRELVRVKGTAPVFFSTNRTERVWVKNEAILRDYQFYLRSLGYVDAVTEVDSIESFGAIVGEIPA